MNVLSNFLLSFRMLKEDKILLFLSSIPVVIGLLFYGLLGGWIFSSIIPWGNELVQGWLSIDWLGSILGWVVKTLITILFFFAINWTFFLFVSLLASPFNDIISSRVEKKLLGKKLDGMGVEFNGLFSKIGFIFFNESKKVLFIILLSLISLGISFFPLLSPVTIFLQAMLVAVNFLDYSWSRNDLSFGQCQKNYRENFLTNTIGGLIGVGLLAIPGLNILSLPILVVFFTINFKK